MLCRMSFRFARVYFHYNDDGGEHNDKYVENTIGYAGQLQLCIFAFLFIHTFRLFDSMSTHTQIEQQQNNCCKVYVGL